MQGPVSDAGQESFVDYHNVAVRHGMTIGELAKLYNSERHINANLTVVPMKGWMRGDWFDSTGLEWVSPSPNLRNVEQATLYSGVALIEGTNVSVGRGTDTPFQVIGAPWIKPKQLAAYLNARLIAGVRFVPTEITPSSSTYSGQLCGAVNVTLTNRETLDAPELGVELAAALHKLYPQQFELAKMSALLANQAALQALQNGEDPRRIEEDWRDGLERFVQVSKTRCIEDPRAPLRGYCRRSLSLQVELTFQDHRPTRRSIEFRVRESERLQCRAPPAAAPTPACHRSGDRPTPRRGGGGLRDSQRLCLCCPDPESCLPNPWCQRSAIRERPGPWPAAARCSHWEKS